MNNSYFGIFVVVSLLTLLYGVDKLNKSHMNQQSQLRAQNVEIHQELQKNKTNSIEKHKRLKTNAIAIDETLND